MCVFVPSFSMKVYNMRAACTIWQVTELTRGAQVVAPPDRSAPGANVLVRNKWSGE